MNNESGNAFLYILIAVVLFGALMFAISKSSDQDDSTGELSQGREAVAVNEILSYAATTTNALTQLQATHVQNDQIDFMLPSDANFNVAPNIYKIFHPDGGGLNYRALPKLAIEDDSVDPVPGYYVGRFNNVEWTPSTTLDILFVAYEIKTSVCEAINKKLTGSTTIPTVSGSPLEDFFIDDTLHVGTNADFMVANCAACEEVAALCVQDAGGKNVFYSLLEAE